MMIGRERPCFALHGPFLLLRESRLTEKAASLRTSKRCFFAFFLPIIFPAFHLLSQM